MKIQNPELAGESLSLRYTRDPESGRSIIVTGDDKGIFDMPTRDAEFLCGTPGWKLLRSARTVDSAPPAPPPVPEAPPAVPEPPAAPEETDTEPVDLATLDREGLFAYAEEHQIEVGSRWGEARLRAHLEAEE